MIRSLPKEIEIVKKYLQKETLPGWKAQRLMSPMDTEKYRSIPKSATPSAIVLTLFKDEFGAWSTIYIKRASRYQGDKHKGQISFPGGKQEPTDADSQACAIRECEEEIGLPAEHIRIIGALSPLYVFVSDFIIYPYVAYIADMPVLRPDPSEVAYIIKTPVDNLFNSKSLRDFKIRDAKITRSPYYALKNEILWGATAMITSEFEMIWNRSANKF